jgi:Uma2 family endonuclease
LWESLETGRVRYLTHDDPDRELEIDGSPDWLMEIVSDGSVIKDSRQLKAAYHRARVTEYWLIDARGPEIRFQIFWWRKSGYAPAPSKDGWQRSRVFGRSFRLTRQTDRRGAWRYTLLIRED